MKAAMLVICQTFATLGCLYFAALGTTILWDADQPVVAIATAVAFVTGIVDVWHQDA